MFNYAILIYISKIVSSIFSINFITSRHSTHWQWSKCVASKVGPMAPTNDGVKSAYVVC